MKSDILIKLFSKKTSQSEVFIGNLWEQIEQQLILQGMDESNKRFYPYLLVKLKKQLKIKEQSSVIRTFKQFLDQKTN